MTRKFARLSLLLLLLSWSAWGQENISALAERSPLEAVNRLLALPAEQRTVQVRALLNSPSMKCRAAAVDVVERTFALALINDLEHAMNGEQNQRLKERVAKLLEMLRLYKPIAVEDVLDAGTALKEEKSREQKATADVFARVPVRIRVLKEDGSPAGDCSVRVYSDDYGVCLPYAKPQDVDASGSVTFDLFPGKWSFFATGGRNGRGMYLCRSDVEISDDETILLKPTKAVTLRFAGSKRKALHVNDVQVVDAAYEGFLDPASLGAAPDGRFELLTCADRPISIVAAAPPQDGMAAVLRREGVKPERSIELSADPAQCARLTFAAERTPASPKEVQVAAVFRCLANRRIVLKAGLPLELLVTPGEADIAYEYETGAGYCLSFFRAGCQLSKGSVRKFTLGGPYECAIYHQFYKDLAKRPNVLAYFLFVQDPNGYYLENCWRPSGKRGLRREPVTIPLVIRRDQKTLFDTAKTKPDRQLTSEAGSIPSEADLASLEYEVKLPFVEGKSYILKGHGDDFEKTSARFHFVGPHELASTADHWLNGAQEFYKIFSEMLHTTPTWKKGDKSDIRFQIKMPPGVGAFASGRGTTFTVGSGLAMTQPWHILDTPFRHELLHRFGHGHRDFMQVTCQEAGVRYCGQLAARMKKERPLQDEIVKCLHREGTPNPDSVIPHVLLKRYGFKVFTDYFDKGRPERDRMETEGLSEIEANCVIFNDLTDGEALGIYQAAGVAIDEEKIEKGMGILKNRQLDSAASDGPSPSRFANKAIKEAEKALEQKDERAALRSMDEAKEWIKKIGNPRMRAWPFCRMGEVCFKNGMKEQAYEMLKECQRAAALVDARYFAKIRRECLNVLKGEPVLAMHFL